MKKLLNMKKKEKPIRTPKEKPKKEARMPKIKREKPKRQPKSKNQNPSVKKLPKPVSVVWEWLKWLGRQILKLIRIIPHPGYVDRNIGNCFLFPILRGLE